MQLSFGQSIKDFTARCCYALVLVKIEVLQENLSLRFGEYWDESR